MPFGEASEILALSLIFVVHVAGGLALVWGMLEGDGRSGPWWRRRRDDGPDGPPSDPPPEPEPRARVSLPLPGSEPARARLRDGTPLREAYPRAPRRPQRTPDRSPSRR
jgi:hypothetical protein